MAMQRLNLPRSNLVIQTDEAIKRRMIHLFKDVWNNSYKAMAMDLGLREKTIRNYFGNHAHRNAIDQVVDAVASFPSVNPEWLLRGVGYRQRQAEPPQPAVEVKPVCERIRQLAESIWKNDREAMASTLGLTDQALSNILDHQISPSDEIIRALEHNAMVNPTWLKTGVGEPHGQATTVEEPPPEPVPLNLKQRVEELERQLHLLGKHKPAEHQPAAPDPKLIAALEAKIMPKITTLETRAHTIEGKLDTLREAIHQARKSDSDGWTASFRRQEAAVLANQDTLQQLTRTQQENNDNVLAMLAECDLAVRSLRIDLDALKQSKPGLSDDNFHDLDERLQAQHRRIQEIEYLKPGVQDLDERMANLEKRHSTKSGKPPESELAETEVMSLNRWARHYDGPHAIRLGNRELRRLVSGWIIKAHKKFKLKPPSRAGGVTQFMVAEMRAVVEWYYSAGLHPGTKRRDWYIMFRSRCLHLHKQ